VFGVVVLCLVLMSLKLYELQERLPQELLAKRLEQVRLLVGCCCAVSGAAVADGTEAAGAATAGAASDALSRGDGVLGAVVL
jgi:hypothetical protein